MRQVIRGWVLSTQIRAEMYVSVMNRLETCLMCSVERSNGATQLSFFSHRKADNPVLDMHFGTLP